MEKKRKSSSKPRNGKRSLDLGLRQLKKELKLIPFDIKREMRFLDLLMNEHNQVRTDAEREVVQGFIMQARAMVDHHQKRLERYEECYRQIKERKSYDRDLLRPEELQVLLGGVVSDNGGPSVREPDLRTGTDG
ncbi:MAG: hypothetical protein AB1640_00835 [bacterium]